MLLSEAITTFLQVDRRPLTTRFYKQVLGRYFNVAGDQSLAAITYESLLAYTADLRQHGYADSSYANFVAILKSFFNWCVTCGYLPVSPLAAIRVRRARPQGAASRAILVDDLVKLLDYTRQYEPRTYAMLIFMADTGCRVGGLISLRLDRLDLKRGWALLEEKGGAAFEAYFSPATAEALTAWLNIRPRVEHLAVWTATRPPYQPVQRSVVNWAVHRMCRLCGASREWNPHAFRHAVGHAYARLGLPPTATQFKLGHSDIQTTLRFYYPNDQEYLEQVVRDNPLAPLRLNEVKSPVLRRVK
jgi:integrase/recombinase XerD